MIKDLGGKVRTIQGLHCNLPPVGEVYNRMTGELEKRPILTETTVKKDQKWFRTPLPEDYDKKRAKEAQIQIEDPEYYDVELEDFRTQEWDRRLNGVWFMNNGKPEYVTGLHYFFMNWWKIDIGYPDFRKTDQRYFYFVQYSIDDPNSLGVVEITKRRQGKTVRAGCFLYDYVSRSKNKSAGVQSKTAEDAKRNVFQNAVVMPFKSLPEFFRPVYDQSKGVTPTSELRFYRTTKRGKKSLEDIGKPELQSVLDWKASSIFSYDGSKLHRYVGDEVGKTIDVNVWDRHQVVRFCCELDGEFIGKMLYTTTVEEMESGGQAFKRLWDASDQNNRNSNGRTVSGLYRYFQPSYETLFLDEYGYANIEKAKMYYVNEREALRQDDRALSGYIRKNPFTPEEAFRIDGETSLFNAMKLNDRIDHLSWMENIFTIGSFEWVDGSMESHKVTFRPRKNGRFKVRYLFDDDKKSNMVKYQGSQGAPMNGNKYVVGCDPYDHDSTVDSRRSDGAFYVYRKFDATDADYSASFIVEYIARPSTAREFYSDVLKVCHYFGAPLLFEDNKIGIKKYFEDHGYGAFLMHLPGSRKPGVSGSQRVHQQIAELTEDYIENCIENVWFPNLLKDWLEFDISNTQKFDAAMAAGYTLIADRMVIYKAISNKPATDARKVFKRYKIKQGSKL